MFLKLALAAVFVVFLGRANAQELVVPLEVEVRYLDLSGQPIAEIDRKTSFQIELSYSRADGMPLPDGLAPHGWLRPHEPSNGTCDAAARQFSLSTHILPRGVIDLSRTLIGVAAEKGAFSVVDPELNLASANMIAAAQLDTAPDWLEADPVGNRFIAVFRDTGNVLAISADTGEVTTLASGLDQPEAAFAGPDGELWIDENGAGRLLRIDLDGTEVVREGLVEPSEADGFRTQLAIITTGSVSLIGTGTEQHVTSFALDNVLTAVPLGHHAHFQSAALVDGALHLLGSQSKTLSLPHPADRLVGDMHGRWLAAFSEGQATPVNLIDLHTGALRQNIPVSTPVTEVAFGHDMLFIMTADQAVIRAVDFTHTENDFFPVRRLGFGNPSDVAVGSGLIAPLDAGHGVIAVHRDSYTGFLIHPVAAKTDMPPMHPVALRGGVPRRISTLSKRFAPAEEGQFLNVVKLGSAAAYEIVVQSGVESRPACFVIPLPHADEAGIETWRLKQLSDGFVLLNGDSIPVANTNLSVLLTGLRTPDRRYFHLRTNQDGVLPLDIASEIVPPLAISATIADGPTIRTLVLD